MVETITPVVHGGRGRWAVAVALHTLAATAVAAVSGATLGALGGALGAPFGRAGAVVVGVSAAAYAAAAFGLVEVPIPALRRQVPDWWRTYFPPLATATLYGAGLGIGFLTFLGTGALVVVAVAAFLGGSAWQGALLMGAFGAARGLTPLVAAGLRTPADGAALVDRIAARPERTRRIVVGVSLVTVAVIAFTIAGSGWSVELATVARLAGAILAVTFAWAAIAKIAAPARWRRALDGFDLPREPRRLAASAVPAAEALVPVLALAGYPHAAAAWAGVLLLVFAAVLIRHRLHRGASVACGCFGGRTELRVSVMLVRVVALLALAGISLATPAPSPRIVWPGAPGAADIVPFTLAALGLALAAALAWQARRTLGSRR